MKLTGKQVILALHRWTGGIAALFLVVLSITGLCLNHADNLYLHDIRVRWPFILERYNMLTEGDIQSLQIDDSNTVSVLDNGLYFNSSYIAESGELVGIINEDQFHVVAATNGLLLLSKEGELIEFLELEQLPFDELKLIGGEQTGKAVLVSGESNWIADNDWLEYQEYGGEFRVLPVDWVDLDEATMEAILRHHQGEGPTVYRVLLDLHSGRLFGWSGRTIMDLAALAILILVISGISGWLRKSRRPRISYSG